MNKTVSKFMTLKQLETLKGSADAIITYKGLSEEYQNTKYWYIIKQGTWTINAYVNV